MNSVMAVVSDVYRSICTKSLLQLQAPSLILRRVSSSLSGDAEGRRGKGGICRLDFSQSLAGSKTVDKCRVGVLRVLEQTCDFPRGKIVSRDRVRVVERRIARKQVHNQAGQRIVENANSTSNHGIA